MPAIELQARSHWAYTNVAGVLLSMTDVSSPKSLRHEVLDAEPNNLVVGIAEERGHLTVRKSDGPGGIDDDHRIRGGLECTMGEFRWRGQHSWCSVECAAPVFPPPKIETRTPSQLIPSNPVRVVCTLPHIEIGASRRNGGWA